MRGDQFSRNYPPTPSPTAPPVRVLMEAGEWKVDPSTVKLAPEPRAENPAIYAMIRSDAFSSAPHGRPEGGEYQ